MPENNEDKLQFREIFRIENPKSNKENKIKIQLEKLTSDEN